MTTIKINKQTRNESLDYYKGVAIFLVVLGHFIQTHSTDYDDQLIFRVIYSFHMPFFMFLSGFTISLTANSAKTTLETILLNIKKRSFRLLVPFLIWGFMSFFVSSESNFNIQAFFNYFILLIKRPDIGLWFLPALFWCLLFFDLATLPIFEKYITLEKRILTLIFLVISYLCLIVFWKVFCRLTGSDHFAGIIYSVKFYPFFVAGYYWASTGQKMLPNVVKPMPLIFFATMIPFYYRNHPPTNLFTFLHIDLPGIDYLFLFCIGIFGIYATLETLFFIKKITPPKINTAISHCGKKSLDIYVCHPYFITIFQNITLGISFSILMSLVISFSIKRIPYLGLFFYGTQRENQ